MSDATNSTDTTTETPAAEKVKRTRTSPRTKALDEVIAALDAALSDLAEEQKENGSELTLDAKIEALSDFKGRVTSMADSGASKPEYAGRHYIARKADGTLAAFDSNVPPTRRSHGPESKHAFANAFGPFRTVEGVEYRLTHDDALADYAPIF